MRGRCGGRRGACSPEALTALRTNSLSCQSESVVSHVSKSGQAVRLEWQSWQERFRILPICGSIISALCGLGAGALETAGGETAGAGTNCIPIKIETSKMGVSFANLRVIRFLMIAKYNHWSDWLVTTISGRSHLIVTAGCGCRDVLTKPMKAERRTGSGSSSF